MKYYPSESLPDWRESKTDRYKIKLLTVWNSYNCAGGIGLMMHRRNESAQPLCPPPSDSSLSLDCPPQTNVRCLLWIISTVSWLERDI